MQVQMTFIGNLVPNFFPFHFRCISGKRRAVRLPTKLRSSQLVKRLSVYICSLTHRTDFKLLLTTEWVMDQQVMS